MKTTHNRVTKQRLVILEELRGLRSHPTAEELYAKVRERLPHVSLGTVYRNLDLLAASGEILQLNAGGNVRRFDGDTHAHCHVRCMICGRVGDVRVDRDLSSATAHAQAEGFAIVASRLEFDGICAACAPCLKLAGDASGLRPCFDLPPAAFKLNQSAIPCQCCKPVARNVAQHLKPPQAQGERI
jgi:Fur family ferric uptake transcriptional regulator